MSGSIFAGSPIPGQPTGNDTNTSFPLWQQQYVYNLSNAATNLAGSPYVAYPGQQVAQPFRRHARPRGIWPKIMSGNYQGALNQATSLTGQAAQPIGPQQINQYLSPVHPGRCGSLAAGIEHELHAEPVAGDPSQFVGAGQAASPQQMQADNNALYQTNQALDQSTAQALQSGYQGALSTALQEQQQQQTAGAQYGQLGALTQELGAGDVAQVAGAGQAQDTTNQANINAAMNNFYAQQQWPYQNLDVCVEHHPGPGGAFEHDAGRPYQPEPERLYVVAAGDRAWRDAGGISDRQRAQSRLVGKCPGAAARRRGAAA